MHRDPLGYWCGVFGGLAIGLLIAGLKKVR